LRCFKEKDKGSAGNAGEADEGGCGWGVGVRNDLNLIII
jgi:hypothetical protein